MKIQRELTYGAESITEDTNEMEEEINRVLDVIQQVAFEQNFENIEQIFIDLSCTILAIEPKEFPEFDIHSPKKSLIFFKPLLSRNYWQRKAILSRTSL